MGKYYKVHSTHQVPVEGPIASKTRSLKRKTGVHTAEPGDEIHDLAGARYLVRGGKAIHKMPTHQDEDAHVSQPWLISENHTKEIKKPEKSDYSSFKESRKKEIKEHLDRHSMKKKEKLHFLEKSEDKFHKVGVIYHKEHGLMGHMWQHKETGEYHHEDEHGGAPDEPGHKTPEHAMKAYKKMVHEFNVRESDMDHKEAKDLVSGISHKMQKSEELDPMNKNEESDVKNIDDHPHYKKAWARSIGHEDKKRHFVTTEDHKGNTHVHHKDDQGTWRSYSSWGEHPASHDQKFLDKFHKEHAVKIADEGKGHDQKFRQGGPGYKATEKSEKSEQTYRIYKDPEGLRQKISEHASSSKHKEGKHYNFHSEDEDSHYVTINRDMKGQSGVNKILADHGAQAVKLKKDEEPIPDKIKDPAGDGAYKFIVANADAVGDSIAGSIANDDHEGLSESSQKLNGAADLIAHWVEEREGQVISRAGDEVIARVPVDALQDLEEVVSRYEEHSGHKLTVGIGRSLSEAALALTQGKDGGGDVLVSDDYEEEDALVPSVEDEDTLHDDDSMLEEAPEDGEIPPEGDVSEMDTEEGEAAASEVMDQEGEEMAEEYAMEEPEMDDLADTDPAMAEEGGVDEQELYDLLSQDLNSDPETATEDEAKQRLLETLQSLREKKDSIESLRDTDPDAYSRLLEFIRTMIDMAKHSSSDGEDQSAGPNIEDLEAGVAKEGDESEEVEATEPEEADEPKEGKEPPKKKSPQ
jgi:hypothetical protein